MKRALVRTLHVAALVGTVLGCQHCFAQDVEHVSFSSKPGVERPGVAHKGGMGLEVSLDWDQANWELETDKEKKSFTAACWSPRVAVFYSVSRAMDIRVAAKTISADDDDGSMDMASVGLGSKYRVHTNTDFEPYVCFLVNYLVSVAADESGEMARKIGDPDNSFGASFEVGVAYLVSDAMDLRVSAHYETLLGAAGVDVDSDSGDYNFGSIGFGLGFSWHF